MAKVTCRSNDVDGFTQHTDYEVLAFGESGVVLSNDGGKITHVGYARLNDDALWSINLDVGAAKPQIAQSQGDAT